MYREKFQNSNGIKLWNLSTQQLLGEVKAETANRQNDVVAKKIPKLKVVEEIDGEDTLIIHLFHIS